jgi:hypothetical protein
MDQCDHISPSGACIGDKSTLGPEVAMGLFAILVSEAKMYHATLPSCVVELKARGIHFATFAGEIGVDFLVV